MFLVITPRPCPMIVEILELRFFFCLFDSLLNQKPMGVLEMCLEGLGEFLEL